MLPSTAHGSLWLDAVELPSFAPLQAPAECDVVVVGAGITGLTLALELARAGKRVMVLERHGVAAGTTGHTTAHLTTMIDTGYADMIETHGLEVAREIASGMCAAIDHIEKTAAAIGVADAFARVPGYYVAEPQEALDVARDEDLFDVARSYRAVCEVGLSAVAALPAVPFRIADGFCLHDQGRLHASRYMAALATAVQAAGGRVCTYTAVLDVDDGAPCTVHTELGTVRASEVVLATHTPLGVSALHTVVSPVRSYVLAARVADEVPDVLVWNTHDPYEYIRKQPMPDGDRIIVGGADHKTGHGDPRASYEHLEHYLRRRFKVRELTHRWSAQLYDPADGLPFVGPAPFAEHVYVATGFSGDGLPLGTLSALMLRDRLLGNEHPLAEICEPSRLNLGGVGKVVKEGLDMARHWIGDRLRADDGDDPATVLPGQAAILHRGGKQVGLYRDLDGQAHEVDVTCTHMKCKLHWNPAEATWDCPCHGGRYDVRGAIIEGPPTRPLPRP
jgi:glycine/D-amino acid oxidase-like deaminating enzyme/nitrite reductase/ring-hydroxylating ferredoxin subunit